MTLMLWFYRHCHLTDWLEDLSEPTQELDSYFTEMWDTWSAKQMKHYINLVMEK